MPLAERQISNGSDMAGAGLALLFVVGVLVVSTLWLRADEQDWPDVPPAEESRPNGAKR